MEKILDWFFTFIFIVAMIAIAIFMFNKVKDVVSGKKGQTINVNGFEDGELEEDDIDNRLDVEDGDYYEDDGEDFYDNENRRLPLEYDESLSDIIDEDPTPELKDENLDVEIETEPYKPVNKPVEKPVEKPVNKPKELSAKNAKYLVLAGSFGSKTNAQTHYRTLTKLGYHPEIVNFINREMHTVVAEKTNNKSTAESIKRKLISQKLECYIYTKK